MKKWLYFINIVVVIFIVIFVVSYSTTESKRNYNTKIDNLENTTMTMARVTQNYLNGEQGICDVWANYISGQEMPDWYDGDILDFMDMETYYYELYLIADDEDGLFDHAEVCKVIGAENDDVHGSCDYEELDSNELKEIVEFIAGLFENE